MLHAEVLLDRHFAIGETDRRLFGAFVEHLGRCIYGGLYCQTTLKLIRRAFAKMCFGWSKNCPRPSCDIQVEISYQVMIGKTELDLEQRPSRLDLAWRSTEPNLFGTNEFIDWCREASIEPMLAVNLGTRDADAARHFLEYCNHPGGTKLSDLRRSWLGRAPSCQILVPR